MAPSVATAAAVLAFLAACSLSQACSLGGNCDNCDALSMLPYEVIGLKGAVETFPNRSIVKLQPSVISCYYGGCDSTSTAGLNYEIFEELYPAAIAPNQVYTSSASTLSACCAACKSFAKCAYYHYIPVTSQNLRFTPPQPVSSIRCYLINIRTTQITPTDYKGAPYSLTKYNTATLPGQNQYWGTYAATYVGGICNGGATGEPHFVGGHGTRYDFNGQIDKPYCIVTDKDVAVNALLSGYKTNRTIEGLGTNGVLTWMKELGIVWNAEGKRNTLRMVARRSPESERGNGFLAALEVNGQSVAVPAVGEKKSFPGNAVLRFLRVGQKGPFEVEYYTMSLGKLSLDIAMRVGQKVLRTAADAQAHFDIQINYVNLSDAVHGVLGQTLQNNRGRVLKSLKYKHLNMLLHRDFHADGKEGAGFLDGTSDDYVTSSILSPDCKYSSF